jgi:hypothetical protein
MTSMSRARSASKVIRFFSSPDLGVFLTPKGAGIGQLTRTTSPVKIIKTQHASICEGASAPSVASVVK